MRVEINQANIGELFEDESGQKYLVIESPITLFLEKEEIEELGDSFIYLLAIPQMEVESRKNDSKETMTCIGSIDSIMLHF